MQHEGDGHYSDVASYDSSSSSDSNQNTIKKRPATCTPNPASQSQLEAQSEQFKHKTTTFDEDITTVITHNLAGETTFPVYDSVDTKGPEEPCSSQASDKTEMDQLYDDVAEPHTGMDDGQVLYMCIMVLLGQN